ncbi:hypothetical protein B5P45_12715 [Phyllobacterium zundukense]|uniref:Anti-sigma factor NepR domain-containing protein n=2 Tax=Phyllobacterium zundukense TaxID=1867719 RepID=A0A2N9VYA2_9HYPH|nr:hypothetical protein BLM14_24975 [Phyllobacterium zundukense]PIO44470.1 hypothetical protein B5P45_12715 [Phyllobacterium zundukense]
MIGTNAAADGFALTRRCKMSDDDKKPQNAKVVREQLERPDLRDALHSRYKPVSNDERFKDLLRQLHDKEPK